MLNETADEIDPIVPRFASKLQNFEIDLGKSKSKFDLISPLIEDPDMQLEKLQFTIIPEMPCKCLKLKQDDKKFKLNIQ